MGFSIKSFIIQKAVVLAVSAMCASAIAATNTWTVVGSATPYTDYPTGTNGTTTEERIAVGTTAAQSTATQFYVLSQKTGVIPFVANIPSGSTSDIARFQANGTSKVLISSAGNVGIGATAPATPLGLLHINGGAYTSIFKPDGALTIGYGSLVGTGGALFVNGNVGIGATSPSANLHVQASNAIMIIDANNSGGVPQLYLRASGSSPGIPKISYSATGLKFVDANAFNRLCISGTGCIGIGDTNPQNNLSVNQPGANQDVSVSFRARNGNSTKSELYFGVNNSSGTGVGATIGANGAFGAGLALKGTTGGTSSPDMFINVSGNVGIGTTNPGSYKLAVEGKIGAREVVVTTAAWSDYVFNKGYNLKPLDEVENYIKTNKHLEGIPTEKEVKAKGVAMGDMQAKLLQKIEELTLYTVELNKKTVELNEKVNQLTLANKELNKKINAK
jgi:Phage T4 tail fibre